MNARTAKNLFVTCAAFTLFVEHDARASSDPDPWFGKDKALHFGVSAGIAAGAYGISSTFVTPRYGRLLIGGGVAIAAGAGKELLDMTGFGDPSWKDFTWDVIGTVVGLGLAWSVDLLIGGVSDAHPLLGPPHVMPPASSPSAFSCAGLCLRF